MWNWDQGRMDYFQYDNLRTIARFAMQNDLQSASPSTIRQLTGLDFAAPRNYHPWRNYARVFKLTLLVREQNGVAIPTEVASLLARDGVVTCDEYMHFLAEVTTSPSPALTGWSRHGSVRYPLCFALRYLLAKVSCLNDSITPINEIIGAYLHSNFVGDESDTDFIGLLTQNQPYAQFTRNISNDRIRQARESIKFLCQISYLECNRNTVSVSLGAEDAREIFDAIGPITGTREDDGNQEIARLATLFRDGSLHDFFDYQETTISNEIDSGFAVANKVRRSHIVIERNSGIRRRFFASKPLTVCDACRLDTKRRYPWTDRVLDLHHALPLSSGTRVASQNGTLLDDLIAICPTCHRAVHRYYDKHLRKANRQDFTDRAEATRVYEDAKARIRAMPNGS